MREKRWRSKRRLTVQYAATGKGMNEVKVARWQRDQIREMGYTVENERERVEGRERASEATKKRGAARRRRRARPS